MARIYLDSKSVPDWFRVKVLAACAPVGGSVLRYWFDDRRHYAEIAVPNINRNLIARTTDCPACEGSGCSQCENLGRVERLEIVGRDNNGREFITRFEDEGQDARDAGGDALGLLVPELTDTARWQA